jgi:hypothetical protein
VWASQHDMARPDVIKGPSRKYGGCARKVAGLIPGGLLGGPKMPVHASRVRRVGGTAVLVRAALAEEESAEAVVPAGVMLMAGKGRTRSRASGRSCS